MIGNGALFVEGAMSFTSTEVGSPTEGSDGNIFLYVGGTPISGTPVGNFLEEDAS